MKQKKFNQLSEQERLDLFSIEELEGRLETAWNDICTDDSCTVKVVNGTCPVVEQPSDSTSTN